MPRVNFKRAFKHYASIISLDCHERYYTDHQIALSQGNGSIRNYCKEYICRLYLQSNLKAWRHEWNQKRN